MASIKFEDFVTAIKSQESEGSNTDNPMQIQQGTFERFKKGKENWNNRVDRVTVANRYIDYLRRTTNGDPSMMAAGYIGGEGGLDKNNWDRTDANGKSISSYVQDVQNRLAKNQPKAVASDIDAELNALPNANIDKELSALPNAAQPPATFMGYSSQELYGAAKLPAEIVGATAGGMLGMGAGPVGAVTGAGLGAVGANRAYQAVGQTFGLLPNETPGQAVNETLNSGISGATGEGIGQVASRLVSKAGSGISNLIRDWIAGKPSPQAIRDAASTGIDLTAFEANGHKLGYQKVLSSIPGSDYKFAERYTTQMEQAGNALRDEVAKLSSGPLTKQGVGERVITSYKQVVDNAFAARSTQGRADFAITDAMMHGRGYIKIDNTLNQMRTAISNYSAMHTAAGDAKALQLTRSYNKLRRDFPDGKITGFAMNAQLAAYGAAAHGNGTIFARLSADAADRAVAGKIYGALDADLGIAANTFNTMQGAVGSSLESARMAWKTNSQYLKELKSNTIGAMLGTTRAPDPTSVYNRVIGLNPATMKQVIRTLDSLDPSVMNDVRARYIQDILEGTVHDTGAKIGQTNPVALHKALEKNPEQSHAMFDQATRTQLDAISRQMERIIKSGSGTPNRAIERFSRIAGGGIVVYPALYGDIGMSAAHLGIASGLYLTSAQLGRILSSTEGRTAMSTIMNRSAGPSAVTRALTNLVTFADKEYGQAN